MAGRPIADILAEAGVSTPAYVYDIGAMVAEAKALEGGFHFHKHVIAYAIKANVEQLEALTGDRAKTISLGGGMTRSELFERILVDVLGRDILVSPVPDVTSMGAYLCGRVAIGDLGNLSEAAGWASGKMRVLKANVRDAAEYEEFYQGWTRLSNTLGQIEL